MVNTSILSPETGIVVSKQEADIISELYSTITESKSKSRYIKISLKENFGKQLNGLPFS